MWPFWISDWNDFSYFFLSTSCQDTSYPVSNQMAFQFRRSTKSISKNGCDLEFLIGMILASLIYKSPFSLLVQKQKREINFQEGHHNSHLGFLTETILAIFNLQVAPILPTKFGVYWPFIQEKKHGHLGFPIGTILAIFDLQVAPILPTKFPVNWYFASGKDGQNKFSRRLPWWPS